MWTGLGQAPPTTTINPAEMENERNRNYRTLEGQIDYFPSQIDRYVIVLSHIMRKPAFCICENKYAVQLPSYCAADPLHRLSNPSTSSIRNFKPLAIFCGCAARFVSDLVGNPEDRFSRDEAHLHMILARQRTTKVQNRLHKCTDGKLTCFFAPSFFS